MTPKCLPYPETTMFGVIAEAAKRTPDAPALDFMGKITTYTEFVKKIDDICDAKTAEILEI